jgi:hypothetical protein
MTGLYVETAGDVTLNNVGANYNEGDGAEIYGARNVDVWNSEFFYNESTATDTLGDPYGNGLWMDGITGNVTLEDIWSMGNSNHGVEVGRGSNDGQPGNGTAGNIYVYGGWYEYNGGDGLHLNADGNIFLNGVQTWGNYDDGADVCAGRNVYVEGSDFYFNGSGIYVRCADNIYSYYNHYYYNYWWDSWWTYDWYYPYSYSYPYYYGYGDYYWGGWYDDWFWGWPLPTGIPQVTIQNIYINGDFIADYDTYNTYVEVVYFQGFNWSQWRNGTGMSQYWYWRWLNKFFPPLVVETQPMSVIINPLTEEDLPGDLPDGKEFTDAFEAIVSDGIPGERAEVFFEVPEGFADGDTLTVLSWNEDSEEWEEVAAEIADGKVTFKIGESGTFALVTP